MGTIAEGRLGMGWHLQVERHFRRGLGVDTELSLDQDKGRKESKGQGTCAASCDRALDTWLGLLAFFRT